MSDPIYYETMYILRPDIPEEEVEKHLTKYSDLLKNSKVDVLDSQMRGKRRLAYPIGKHKEGIYVQLSHQGDGQQVALLEKAMRLSEDVIRYLTVKQEGPLPTPKQSPSESKKEESSSKEEVKEDKNLKEGKKTKKEEIASKEEIKEDKNLKEDKETKNEATASKEEIKEDKNLKEDKETKKEEIKEEKKDS